ncbi:hypothetical protein M9Y10_034080 [Tritrichomonas musculus]|uniref:Clan SC, family S28, unassigned serine peptidase n=1 Tax=Tritrichomonas musculus TaxID=1915356 RepID=A0ABR2KDX9_9EUKA
MLQFLLLFFLRFHFEIPKIGKQYTFHQKLDHFNSSDNVFFDQIYYQNDTFLDKSNPSIVVYIGGEATMSYENTIPSGAMEDITLKTGSSFIALEHRFYGKSAPFEYDLTTENLKKYLTSDQALADLAVFITEKKKEVCINNLDCRVLVIGGSYAGTLSSMFRMKYPHIANYSWASSPPLNIKLDFYEYDWHVGNSIKKRDQKCYDRTKIIMNSIESNITNYNYFRSKTNFKNSTDRVSCLSAIADLFAGMVQYDLNNDGINDYCGSKITTLDEFINYFNNSVPNPDDSDSLLLNESSYYQPIDYKNSRAWTWQTCNEFGWFQTAYHDDSVRFRSKEINLSYYDRICRTLFDVGLPSVDDINLRYGLTSPKTTNVIYVNGLTDPWSQVSILDNQVDQTKQQFSFHIDGGSHCSDLRKYPNETKLGDLVNKRNEIIRIIMNWYYFNESECSKHGQPSLSCCVCSKSRSGLNCENLSVMEKTFKVFSGLVVALPTLMMIVIGIAAWRLFQKEQSEPQIRTIIS